MRKKNQYISVVWWSASECRVSSNSITIPKRASFTTRSGSAAWAQAQAYNNQYHLLYWYSQALISGNILTLTALYIAAEKAIIVVRVLPLCCD